MSQSNYTEYTKEHLRKNKPTKVLPIMNTCFALILLAAAIYVKVLLGKAFPTLYFVIFLILVILFPIGSWYNSYFSKIQNVKKIKNYDTETKEIVAYIKHLKSYKGVELNREFKLNFKVSYDDNITVKDFSYNDAKYSFGTEKENAIIVTVGVSFAGLEFRGWDKKFVGLCGVMPKSIWIPKKLKAPLSKKGQINIEASGFVLSEKTIVQAMKNQDTFYDKKSGWLVVGERKGTILDENVEIINNVIAVIRNEELVALWIKVGENKNLF